MSLAIDDVAATLLLPQRKHTSFSTVVCAALENRLCEMGHVVRKTIGVSKHIMRFEVDGAHIVLAYCPAPVTPADYRRFLRPGQADAVRDAAAIAQLSVHRSCLILSARAMPLPGYPAPTQTEIESLMHSMITTIREEVRVSLVLWGETRMLYTEKEFAEVIARTAAVHPIRPLRQLPAGEIRERPVLPIHSATDADTGPAGAEPNVFGKHIMDIQNLHDRLDDTLSQTRKIRPRHSPLVATPRTERPAPLVDEAEVAKAGSDAAGSPLSAPSAPSPAPSPAPDSVANDLPDLPGPMVSETARIRSALYPEPPREMGGTPEKGSTPFRVAIYTLNTSLILVSLPVGMAVLTYNVLGRENMNLTARATALTGIAIGLLELPFAQALLGLI